MHPTIRAELARARTADLQSQAERQELAQAAKRPGRKAETPVSGLQPICSVLQAAPPIVKT